MLNLLELNAICHIAGATCLVLYLAVFAAHWRLREQAGGSRLLILAGAAPMLAALVAQVIHLRTTRPSAIAVTVVVVLGSLGVEWLILRRGRSTR